jgi:hypothetical protein
MGMSIDQRISNRNQSIADYEQKKIFIFDNRYEEVVFTNKTGAELTIVAGMAVVRDSGTYEKATVVFPVAGLTAAQTFILAGLTFTSTGVTTQAELAAAFANLLVGATTGAGTGKGTYSGTLANFTTGPVVSNSTVVFTNIAVGNTTNLAKTGTGPDPAITVVAGSTAVANGVVIATSSNLADVIGITAHEGEIVLPINGFANINIGVKGTVDGQKLTLPDTVLLTTLVGSKNFRDILETVGFHVDTDSTEHTNFDN